MLGQGTVLRQLVLFFPTGLSFAFMKSWWFFIHAEILFCLRYIPLTSILKKEDLFVLDIHSSFPISSFLDIYRMDCLCRCNLYRVMKTLWRLSERAY